MVSDGLFADGRKNAGVLVRLKDSARICRLNRSAKAKFLKMEKSRFLVAGPLAALLANVPNCVSAVPLTFKTDVGCENAAGLKKPSGPAFGRYIETPGTPFGTLKVANN